MANRSRLSASDMEEIVYALYKGFLGRAPKVEGLRFWGAKLEANEPVLSILGGLLRSPEYQARRVFPDRTREISQKLARTIDAHSTAGPMIVVDVGAQAAEDEDHIYYPLLANTKTRVIGFEPIEDRRREREQMETATDLSMRPSFIGDGGQHTFHFNRPDSTSSLLPFNRFVTENLVDLCSFETISTETVSTTTLDQALSDIERVDFLKLDIQGFEYQALVNARAILSKTLVVHCEVEFLQLYQGQALFSEIDQLLRGLGFRFIDFAHLRRYPFKCDPLNGMQDQLAWGDAVYFKDKDQITDDIELLRQGLMAASIYQKLSLARFLVSEYDRRASTAYDALFGMESAMAEHEGQD